MKSILVYDASLRIFHAAFAASLTAALVLALAVDKHSAWFAWQMVSSTTLVRGAFKMYPLNDSTKHVRPSQCTGSPRPCVIIVVFRTVAY